VGKEFNLYLYWGTRQYFQGVCSHSVLKQDTGMCHPPPPGSGVPSGCVGWTQALAQFEKVSHLRFQGNMIPLYPPRFPLANLNRDREIKVFFLAE